MHWILQNNLFNESGWETLRQTLQRFSLPFSEHKVIPFVGELLPPPDLTHQNVICFGAYSMRHVARQFGWNPGVFDLSDFDFQLQRAHWGAHMLNAQSQVMRFADASFFAEHLFLRPVNDSKNFAGKVFSRTEFNHWQAQVLQMPECDPGGLTPDTLIQLSTPRQIYAEYRFWLVKGQIVTHSLYKRGQQVVYAPQVDARFVDFVRARAAEWLPLETLVMDVCDCEDGIKIVEINTLNAAGFYAADMQRLVIALQEGYDTQTAVGR